MPIVEEFLSLLELDALEVNLYRGRNRDVGTGRVFGGQVFAQALVAARRTVSEPREAHSVHGYFLREGDIRSPIVYYVDRPRDGGSFTSRRVTAIQHGEAIFHLSASFHREEPGLEHQAPMPDAPPPESLPNELDILKGHAAEIPASLRDVLTQERPLDFRPVLPRDPFAPAGQTEAKRLIWFRTLHPIPDAPILHQAVLAYASDYSFLPTALFPHGIGFRDPRLMIASLDHTLWMHRPFRADQWLLYACDSPAAHGARGFVRGQVFARDGTLIASVAQEGLMRIKTRK